jgi:hypothetical protein
MKFFTTSFFILWITTAAAVPHPDEAPDMIWESRRKLSKESKGDDDRRKLSKDSKESKECKGYGRKLRFGEKFDFSNDYSDPCQT